MKKSKFMENPPIDVELTKIGHNKDFVVDPKNGYAKIKYTVKGKKVKPKWVRDFACSPPVEVFYVKELDKMLYVYNDIHYGSGTTIKLLNS